MMTVTPHEATITIDHPDRALVREMLFAATRAIGEFYGERLGRYTTTVFHDTDAPCTARVVWTIDEGVKPGVSER